ncbi:MAG: hypothetical protein GC134_06575 [Proteobacteria bacterium]|nr:hypothetical protein [Pseudomonadota bacterium]
MKNRLCALALALVAATPATALEMPEYGIVVDPIQALSGLNQKVEQPIIEPVLLGEFSMGMAQKRLEDFYKPVTAGQEYVNITAYSEDMDGDGTNEYIVMVATAKTCSIAGCQVDVLHDQDGKTFRVLYSGRANQVFFVRDTPTGKANLIMDQTRTEESAGKTNYLSNIVYVRASDGTYTETQ